MKRFIATVIETVETTYEVEVVAATAQDAFVDAEECDFDRSTIKVVESKVLTRACVGTREKAREEVAP
jgi:hypothetical protein